MDGMLSWLLLRLAGWAAAGPARPRRRRARCASTSRPTPATSIRSSSTPTPPRSSSRSLAWPSSRSSISTRAGRPVRRCSTRSRPGANGGLSADGRTIVYRLRRGVRWSDGVPVTAHDVLFTLHAILDPRNPVRSHEGYDLIDRAYARDAHTVVFHLQRAWAPAVMTYFSYGFSPQFVLPAHVLASQTPLAQRAVQRGAGGRRRTVSLRLVAARRGAALRGEPALLARRARGRARWPSSVDSRSVDELAAAAIGRARLEPGRAGAARDRCAATRASASSPCRPPWSRAWRSTRRTRRSTTCACAARWRCRSIAKRSRARSRWATIR